MTTEDPAGVRYVTDVSPADLGVRVVVRRRIPGGATDVLGYLQSWGDGRLVVRTRALELVEVLETDLLAAKRIPEPPVRRPARPS